MAHLLKAVKNLWQHLSACCLQAIAYVYELMDGEIKVDKVEFSKS